jgi:hypothetical protein
MRNNKAVYQRTLILNLNIYSNLFQQKAHISCCRAAKCIATGEENKRMVILRSES